jgi:hypothetical protein
MSPYERFADLTEAAVEAVRTNRLDDLASLLAARGALCRALPPEPPPQEGDALVRAAVAQAQLEGIMVSAMAATRGRLEALRDGRTAAQGYAPPAPKHLDRVG